MPYQMTAGEELIYRELSDILTRVKGWNTLTSWDSIANVRQSIYNTKVKAERNLSDPKKVDVTTRLQALWDGYRAKKAEGWSSLQGYYSRGITRARDILGMTVFEATQTIKQETGIEPPVTTPVAVNKVIEVSVPSEDGKILGMSKPVAIIGGLAITGLITYLAVKN